MELTGSGIRVCSPRPTRTLHPEYVPHKPRPQNTAPGLKITLLSPSFLATSLWVIGKEGPSNLPKSNKVANLLNQWGEGRILKGEIQYF
jgi:hypothetical protein